MGILATLESQEKEQKPWKNKRETRERKKKKEEGKARKLGSRLEFSGLKNFKILKVS